MRDRQSLKYPDNEFFTHPAWRASTPFEQGLARTTRRGAIGLLFILPCPPVSVASLCVSSDWCFEDRRLPGNWAGHSQLSAFRHFIVSAFQHFFPSRWQPPDRRESNRRAEIRPTGTGRQSGAPLRRVFHHMRCPHPGRRAAAHIALETAPQRASAPPGRHRRHRKTRLACDQSLVAHLGPQSDALVDCPFVCHRLCLLRIGWFRIDLATIFSSGACRERHRQLCFLHWLTLL